MDFERDDVLLPLLEVVFERGDELLPPPDVLARDELPPCVLLAAVAFPPLAPALAFWVFEPADPAFDCDDLAEPDVLEDAEARPPEAFEAVDLPPPLLPDVRLAPPELEVRDDAEARPPLAPALAF